VVGHLGRDGGLVWQSGHAGMTLRANR
jgi:hypothetical protein